MKVTCDRRSRAVQLTLVLALAAMLAACSGEKAKANAPREVTVPVVVAAAEQRNIPVRVKAIGAVEAFSTVGIKTQVTGQLMKVHFKEGQEVRKGQLLFTLDRRPFEADLRRAEGNLQRTSATAKNAAVQARRYEALLKEGVVAQQQYDEMQSTAAASEAGVAADRAAVENAKVQLQYTTITSPIDGRTGDLVVHEGNMVKANADNPLVTINQIIPINVAFTLPELFLADVKKFMAAGTLKVQAVIENDPLPVEGSLAFIDNVVDRATGTIKLKGTFPNKDRRLWPGQFVNVVLTLTTESNVVVVPSQAVQTGQTGEFVFVVKADNTAELRPVKVRRSGEGLSVIQQGLQAGERVVTDGQLRLAPGAKVQIKSGSGSEGGADQGTRS